MINKTTTPYIPTNGYGYVDVINSIPEGFAHIDVPYVSHICRKLGIDFEAALVGWDQYSIWTRSYPITSGVVIHKKHQRKVMKLVRERDARKARAIEKKQQRLREGVVSNFPRMVDSEVEECVNLAFQPKSSLSHNYSEAKTCPEDAVFNFAYKKCTEYLQAPTPITDHRKRGRRLRNGMNKPLCTIHDVASKIKSFWSKHNSTSITTQSKLPAKDIITGLINDIQPLIFRPKPIVIDHAP